MNPVFLAVDRWDIPNVGQSHRPVPPQSWCRLPFCFFAQMFMTNV